MADFDRIEPETETHRTEKALREIVREARLPLRQGTVEVRIGDAEIRTQVGQQLLALLTHLLARMKGIVSRVVVRGRVDESRLPGVPLSDGDVESGLTSLLAGLSGPESEHTCEIEFAPAASKADVRLGIGPQDDVDLVMAADAWRALTGKFASQARWDDRCPFGAQMAAVIGAAEAFKRLLHLNLDVTEGTLVDDLALSLFDYGVDDGASPGPDIPSIRLKGVAVAGAGAGGTAALYALASFPEVAGEIVAVEPGPLKASSLGRYLMSDYRQVHEGMHKLDSVRAFLAAHAPDVQLVPEPSYWHEVDRQWEIVLCTVDTPEARRDVQRSSPSTVLDAGVVGMIYTVLRLVPGGWCLECKHPPDPDVTWKRRASMWGVATEEMRQRFRDRTIIAEGDIERLALVQGRPAADFLPLVGQRFDEVPSITECGETPLSLVVPSQAPVLPLTTTAAGLVLAAEVAKELTGIGPPIRNHFAHDLRHRPRESGLRFRPRRPDCPGCKPIPTTAASA